MLLLETVGPPLCFPLIQRPCFERQICKTRRYRGQMLLVAPEDPAFGALPWLKCGPCAIHSVGFVQAGTPNGHAEVFFPSCCKFQCF